MRLEFEKVEEVGVVDGVFDGIVVQLLLELELRLEKVVIGWMC